MKTSGNCQVSEADDDPWTFSGEKKMRRRFQDDVFN